jgi:hypothetical protein
VRCACGLQRAGPGVPRCRGPRTRRSRPEGDSVAFALRELENVIERALILSTGSTLRLEELRLEESLRAAGRRAAGPAHSERLDEHDRAHIQRVVEACGWKIHGKGNAAEQLGLHPQHPPLPDAEARNHTAGAAPVVRPRELADKGLLTFEPSYC